MDSKGHPAIRAPTEVGILDEIGAGDRATLQGSKDAVLGREERVLCRVLDIVEEKSLLVCKDKVAGYFGTGSSRPRKVRQY